MQHRQNFLAFIGEPTAAHAPAVFDQIEMRQRIQQQHFDPVIRHQRFELLAVAVEWHQRQDVAQTFHGGFRPVTTAEPLTKKHAQAFYGHRLARFTSFGVARGTLKYGDRQRAHRITSARLECQS